MGLKKETVDVLKRLLQQREMGWDTRAKALIVRDVYGNTADFVQWHLSQWSEEQNPATEVLS